MRRRRSDPDTVNRFATAIRHATDVAHRVTRGDLDARLGPLGLDDIDPDTERDFRTAVNDMLDIIDAYVRESTAAIVAANQGHFYRRLLETGLSGVFLDGARTIESGRVAMEAAHEAATSAADARSDLAARLESTLLGLTQEMTTAAATPPLPQTWAPTPSKPELKRRPHAEPSNPSAPVPIRSAPQSG
jgi:hypothetical protein